MLLIVASLAEAWIEIRWNRSLLLTGWVASLAEAWIEIRPTKALSPACSTSPPRGGVD